ncbi:hypothetical protein [Streptomyces gardneri]|uniref:hypothetical protein n=1 Tax=Streptomyces gardneri TaxID=66892 RepID=UPI003696B1E5
MAGIEYDELDPLLIAAIEDHFATIHPLDLLDEVLQSDVPEAAEQAYAEMVIDAIADDGDGDFDALNDVTLSVAGSWDTQTLQGALDALLVADYEQHFTGDADGDLL